MKDIKTSREVKQENTERLLKALKKKKKDPFIKMLEK